MSAEQAAELQHQQNSARALLLIESSSFLITGMDQRQEAFPAPSKHATGLVNGVETEVSSINFSDKIMVTISQDGRLAQWVRCFC